MWRKIFLLGNCVLVLASLAGCGGDDGFPRRVPVEVQVTYNGDPVEGAHVTFAPAGEGRAAFGTTGASGTTLLSTFGEDDGALPGTYQVGVRKTEIATGDGDSDDPMAMPAGRSALSPTEFSERLPAKYASPARSELEANVTEGQGSNTFHFELAD